MAYRYHSPLTVPNPEALQAHATALLAHAETGRLLEHAPDPSGMDGSEPVFWKALDLTHVALDLSGREVWNVNARPGGASIATTRKLAATYLRSGGGSYLTDSVMQGNMDREPNTYPSTRILVALGSGISRYVRPAEHNAPAHIHSDERITRSMRFSYLDPASQELVRDIFSLPADFDKEFIGRTPLPKGRGRPGLDPAQLARLRQIAFEPSRTEKALDWARGLFRP